MAQLKRRPACAPPGHWWMGERGVSMGVYGPLQWGTLLWLDGGLHAAEEESCWSSDDLS